MSYNNGPFGPYGNPGNLVFWSQFYAIRQVIRWLNRRRVNKQKSQVETEAVAPASSQRK
jgi:hypothetical protein